MSSGEDDIELEMIMARKRRELMALASQRPQPKVGEKVEARDPLEVVRGLLVERGDEVLDAALRQYPKETAEVVRRLAEVAERGGIKGGISGRQLLWLFNQLGLDVHLDTNIYVEQDGRFVPLMDAMKKKE